MRGVKLCFAIANCSRRMNGFFHCHGRVSAESEPCSRATNDGGEALSPERTSARVMKLTRLDNSVPNRRTSRGRHRLVGAILLFSLFFLPFHFHPLMLATDIDQGCSCIHGLLTQLGPTPTQEVLFHTFASWFVAVFKGQKPAGLHVNFQAARAPPTPFL
jgi:hypothetical protein